MAMNLANISSKLGALKSSSRFLAPKNITKNSTKRGLSDKPWPPEHLKRKMEIFQRDDGIPVYLKGGFGDKMLFGFTCIMTIAGFAWGMCSIIGMIIPKKK